MKLDHAITNHGFAVGLMCGVAVGATLGLLFAPSDGKQLRGQIGDSARRLGRQSSEAVIGAKAAVAAAVGRGREVLAAGRDAFERTRPDADVHS